MTGLGFGGVLPDDNASVFSVGFFDHCGGNADCPDDEINSGPLQPQQFRTPQALEAR